MLQKKQGRTQHEEYELIYGNKKDPVTRCAMISSTLYLYIYIFLIYISYMYIYTHVYIYLQRIFKKL